MLEITICMKKGKVYEFKMKDDITIDEIMRDLNKNKFIRFGNVVFNVQEIETVSKTESP